MLPDDPSSDSNFIWIELPWLPTVRISPSLLLLVGEIGLCRGLPSLSPSQAYTRLVHFVMYPDVSSPVSWVFHQARRPISYPFTAPVVLPSSTTSDFSRMGYPQMFPLFTSGSVPSVLKSSIPPIFRLDPFNSWLIPVSSLSLFNPFSFPNLSSLPTRCSVMV